MSLHCCSQWQQRLMYNTRAWVQGKSYCLSLTTKAAAVKAALTCTSCCPSTSPLLQLHHLHSSTGIRSVRIGDTERQARRAISSLDNTLCGRCSKRAADHADLQHVTMVWLSALPAPMCNTKQ